MKVRSKFFIITLVILIAAFAAGVALALPGEDGQLFRRNVSKTPEQETEKAAMSMMRFYVPAQASDGTLLTEGITYYLADDSEFETRLFAKPLISSYIDELEHEEDEAALTSNLVTSGAVAGAFDAYAAVSLDDGATWKRANLSMSADKSSFTIDNSIDYPGAAYAMVHAVAGDRVMAAWLSRYCDGGEPLYTFPAETVDALQPLYPHLDDLYLWDIFGVAGTQKSVDYTDQGFPEVGEIPFGCVWTARGRLLPVADETTGEVTYDILWTKAERLTSGRRDPNRLEIAGVENAGFSIIWQEDPEGLRPGQGLGPGEGWSGAVVNQKTDLWYSYIRWDDFDDVFISDVETYDATNITSLDLYLEASADDTIPQIVVPMAMPSRISDNDMCKPTGDDPWCYYDFDQEPTFTSLFDPEALVQTPESDFCSTTATWVRDDKSMIVCVAEDGRAMTGTTGSSRPRISGYRYTIDDLGTEDTTDDIVSAWVLFAAEESKGMGYITDEEEEPLEIGKNMWYYTFDMFKPTYVEQGLMLNQPAPLDPVTGLEAEDLVDEWGYTVYNTEIARRFSLIAQSGAKALAAESNTTAYLLYKQGILNQGGPADIFARRIVIPEDIDLTTMNPFAYEYMVCDDGDEGTVDWLVEPSLPETVAVNPNYIHGLCNTPAVNVSGTSIVACDGLAGDCTDSFPWDGGTNDFPKVTEWAQSGPDFVSQTGPGVVDDWGNLDDQSYENPYDVAKGHRGFLDGDFLMVLYAWAPNWKANSVGNDHYNLYIRRSFDGGQTFTTLPATFNYTDLYTGETTAYNGDGTEFIENYGLGGDVTPTLLTFGPGEFENSRNVSQLIGNKVTILDPRYSPTGGLTQFVIEDVLEVGMAEPYWDDAVRDPSKFFVVYETGDNTTVAEGEAVPLDLFYSRAYDFGDDYDLVEYEKDGETVLLFDWLENKKDDLSGEASVTANPGGTFFYAVWNQWQEPEPEVVAESDMIFRRVLYNDTVDTDPLSGVLYASTLAIELGDEITLLGTARDTDHLGEGAQIVEYGWYIDNETEPAYTGRDWKWRVTNIRPGFHSFGFAGKDNEGNWSKKATVTIMVVEELHTLHLPTINR